MRLRFIYRIIIFLICILQLVIGPFLSYVLFNENNTDVLAFNYFMSVPMFDYYLIVIPSLIAFYFGLFYKFNFIKHNLPKIDLYKTLQYLKSSKKNFKVGLLIFVFNCFAFTLSELNIFFHVNISSRILDSSILVGLFYFLYSKNIFRKPFICITYLFFLFKSIQTGMFGTLFFTTFLIGMFYINFRNFSLRKFFFNSILAIFLFVSFQSIKSEYREATFDGTNKNSNISLYFELLANNFTNPELLFNKQTLFFLNIRLNQGHFLSKVFEHVPQYEDYTYGSNVVTGIAAAFVPRILWKDKPLSGGKDEIVKYANVEHDGQTSINISPIGEAYVVYGFISSILLMYLFGLFINFVWSKFEYHSVSKPNLLLWLPVFILPMFQAPEENISTLLNYLIKFLFIFYILYLILPKYFFYSKHIR